MSQGAIFSHLALRQMHATVETCHCVSAYSAIAFPRGVSQLITPAEVMFWISLYSNTNAAFNWNGLVNISQEARPTIATKTQKLRVRVLYNIICTSNDSVWLLTESQISPVIESNSLLHRCYFLTQMGMTLTKRAKQGRNSLESCCILWWDDSMEKNVREYLMSLLLPYCGDIWLKIFYATKYLVQ